MSAAMSCFVLVPSGALAEPEGRREREILIGTIQTRDAGEAREVREADRGKAAGRILTDAMDAIESGDVMLGRQRLEFLVERYPDTLAGATARLELGQLYSGRPSTYRSQTESRGAKWPATRGETTYDLREPTKVDGLSGAGLHAVAPQTAARDFESQGRRQGLRDERRLQALTRDFQATVGDRVFFGDGDSDLGARARAVLAGQARWLSAHGELDIEIEAHADDKGSAQFNFEIAERRGNEVRERLIAEGVSPDRITIQVAGSERPVATCSAPECAAQNRRVVTHVRGSASAAEGRRPAAGAPSAILTAKGTSPFANRD